MQRAASDVEEEVRKGRATGVEVCVQPALATPLHALGAAMQERAKVTDRLVVAGVAVAHAISQVPEELVDVVPQAREVAFADLLDVTRLDVLPTIQRA